MDTHTATITWIRSGPDFLRRRYSREHTWHFDGGLSVPASASPHLVPAPWSEDMAVDPEEAFVASVASCHMLWFLHFACDAGFIPEHYEDEASGAMSRNEGGKLWISQIILRPRVDWCGALPADEVVRELHQKAHDECFIANSILSGVSVEPVFG